MSTAVTPAPASAPAPLFDPNTIMEVWSSFGDLAKLSAKEKATVIRLLQGGAEPLANHIGETLRVEHLLAHRVEVADVETGELQSLDRIVLLDSKGQAYQCVSDGIRKSIGLMAQFYGMPPWKGGLAVKVEQITTKRGFRTFILTPVE